MKKLSKVFLSIALVLMVCLPMVFMTGCDLSDLFNKDKKELTNIALSGNIKTDYYVGDLIDLNNAKLILRYSDDMENILTLTDDLVEGFDTSTYGNKTLKIKYKGKELSVDYKVYLDLTGHRWCVSKFVGPQYEHTFSTTPTPTSECGGYMYLVFNSNFTGKIYNMDLETSNFVEGQNFTYQFKLNSTSELEIQNIGGFVGNNTTIEILSSTQMKLILTGENSHFILIMDYYIN